MEMYRVKVNIVGTLPLKGMTKPKWGELRHLRSTVREKASTSMSCAKPGDGRFMQLVYVSMANAMYLV